LLLRLGKLGIVDFQVPSQLSSLGFFCLEISGGRVARFLGFRGNQLAALGGQTVRNLFLNLLSGLGQLFTL